MKIINSSPREIVTILVLLSSNVSLKIPIMQVAATFKRHLS